MPERHGELARELGEAALARLERDVTLAKIDEAWSQYLEEVGQTKEDVAWVSLAGVPLHEYQRSVARMFETFWERIDAEVLEAFASGTATAIAAAASGTGATWTYQTNDQAFPHAMARLAGTLRRLLRGRADAGRRGGAATTTASTVARYVGFLKRSSARRPARLGRFDPNGVAHRLPQRLRGSEG